MSDIVERLRDWVSIAGPDRGGKVDECARDIQSAADEIERLRQLLRLARKTIALLTPFPPDDCSPILREAINSTADRADAVRKQISAALEGRQP